MIRRLEGAGLVSIDGAIKLTEAGNTLAEKVVRRHRLAERFLTDILGLSWADAHAEAGKWEHVISEPVEAGHDAGARRPHHLPARQPHPGLGLLAARPPSPSAASAPGATFTVSRITEELEFAPGLLEFLEEAAVVPGQAGTVTAASPDGTLTLDIDGRPRGHRLLRQRPHPRHRRLSPATERQPHPASAPSTTIQAVSRTGVSDVSLRRSGSTSRHAR